MELTLEQQEQDQQQDLLDPAAVEQESFENLVAEAIAFANKWIKPFADAEKAFNEKFAAQADLFIRLKNHFHTVPGSHKQTVRVVDGVEHTWTTFCPAHLGVSARWVNKQIQKYRATQDGAGAPEPKPDEEKPLYKKGYEAGRQKAIDEMAVANAREPEALVIGTCSEDEEDGLPTDPQGTEDADALDVLTFFAQFKKDKEAMAEEFRRVLRHYGMTRQIAVELL
jgi:hypothetical protein